jgi:hypothetical protein
MMLNAVAVNMTAIITAALETVRLSAEAKNILLCGFLEKDWPLQVVKFPQLPLPLMLVNSINGKQYQQDFSPIYLNQLTLSNWQKQFLP